jgi:hypothetical protein
MFRFFQMCDVCEPAGAASPAYAFFESAHDEANAKPSL